MKALKSRNGGTKSAQKKANLYETHLYHSNEVLIGKPTKRVRLEEMIFMMGDDAWVGKVVSYGKDWVAMVTRTAQACFHAKKAHY